METKYNYRTTYSFVCLDNGRVLDYDHGCITEYIAAVMEIWRGDTLVSRDKFVGDECWIKLRPDDPDFDEKGEAIKKRKLYRIGSK